MKNFRDETKKWRRKEMTAKDYAGVEEIVSDNALLELAACCFAVAGGCGKEPLFSKRVMEILKTPGLHLESAIYLVYNKVFTLEEAKELYQKLLVENNFQPEFSSELESFLESSANYHPNNLR